LFSIIERIQGECAGAMIVVRLSVFDTLPYKSSRDVGEPISYRELLPYDLGFGVAQDDPLRYDLGEPIELLRRLQAAGVAIVNLSCGSPYYNPHIQRPAIFPPSDGYLPPEDPLVGVWRQIDVSRQCKLAVPGLPMVGSGYSYLQDFLPHVAQAVVREGWIDFVGLGRMVLAYPELPADCLENGALKRKRVCRTFSDCTTAPRHELVSGCYPLDPYYKALPEAARVKAIKQEM
jgi:2,4-dienoyl-CoA reductase-like NADH-dependent reductase (Old Yellow Enzyme family)